MRDGKLEQNDIDKINEDNRTCGQGRHPLVAVTGDGGYYVSFCVDVICENPKAGMAALADPEFRKKVSALVCGVIHEYEEAMKVIQ